MKKVIVTGATGFIGKSLVKFLSDQNVKTYAVVRDISKAKELMQMKNISVIECRSDELNLLSEKIKGEKIDVFYHFSWEGVSGDSRKDYKIQLSNIEYTCDFVKVAYELGCKRFIYAGSIAEHESIKYMSGNGATPSLDYIYKTAKLTAHYMAQTLSANYNIDFICATISNVYGVGDESLRLIGSSIRKILKGEKTSFTNGEQMYDFIYIDDVVRALVAVTEKGKAYTNYFIGNEKPKKLKYFLEDMKNCINSDIRLGLGEIEFNGESLDYTEFDTRKLYEDTGFRCNTGFTDGIIKTVEWINKCKNKNTDDEIC